MLVITSSPDCAIAPTVDVIAEEAGTLMLVVPVWSKGAVVAAPFHSLISAAPVTVAGFMVKVALLMPPGLVGWYQISLRPSVGLSISAAEVQPAGPPDRLGV